MEIQLKEMEELEKKYNIRLHIEQSYGELDKYYEIKFAPPLITTQKIFLGNSLNEVKTILSKKYDSACI